MRRDEGGSWRIGDEGVVRARIDHDLQSDDRVPLLAIDGRPVGRTEFGEMLMNFEGWSS